MAEKEMSCWDDPLFQLWMQHPSASPKSGSGGLYNPPSFTRSTLRFMQFRDQLVRQDPKLSEDTRDKIRQIDVILGWREAVPRDLRFWRPDGTDPSERP